MSYKIKKIDSAPYLSMEELAQFRKCYLGVSINNPFFREQHLGLLLKWISKNFDECIILIGDYLHRINETIIHGKTGEEAVASSTDRGDVVHEKLDIALSLLPADKFKVYRWKEFLDLNPQTWEVKEKLADAQNRHADFRDAIVLSCTEFVNRLLLRGEQLALSKEEAIEKSKEYLLEEMAVFSVLIEQGYTVQVYPGTQLQILKDLANKQIAYTETNLVNGVYVDLTAKKIKR